ncbi:restriction endonuclease subunit S [Mycoplasmopsis felifaucium]|uniref:Restriction endonuclease subunit S n=1 Tax=Mycoplasmopsis felifaucium TaxID=35768 RepID=A0ABZ2RVW8_9BACT
MSNKRMVPEVRFRGFEDCWYSSTIQDIALFRRGSFPQPYGLKKWYDGPEKMPFIQVVDLCDNMSLKKQTQQYISKIGQDYSVFIPSKSVIVTLQGSVGKVAITNYDAYLDRTLLWFEKFIHQTDKFMWSYLIYNKFEIEKKLAPGGVIKTITKDVLKDFKIVLPTYQEQYKIGEFFKNIDNLITQTNNKLDKLKDVKKSLLNKMFPLEGKLVPEIRFKNFSENWKKFQFSEHFYKTGSININGLKLESYSVTNSDGFVNQKELFKIGGIAVYADKSKSRVIEPNTFAYNPARIDVGSIAYWDKNYNILISPMYECFKSSNYLNDNFLIQWFKTDKFNEIVINDREGGVRMCLNFGKFTQIETTFSDNLLEQSKIAEFLTAVDKLITLTNTKLSKLKDIKKALLQKMFV